MNSLYGDLPPPKSDDPKEKNEKDEQKEIKNDTINSNSYNTMTCYVDIKKTIMPTSVQKKVGVKKMDKISCENKPEESTNSIEKETLHTKDVIQKNVHQMKNVNTNEVNESREVEMKNNSEGCVNEELNLFLNETDNNLLDMNDYIQSDLKKINQQLNNIQKGKSTKWTYEDVIEKSKNDYENNVGVKQRKFSTKEIENEKEKEKENEDTNRNEYNSANENDYHVGNGYQHQQKKEKKKEITKETNVVSAEEEAIATEKTNLTNGVNPVVNNILFDKYYVIDADEEYDPASPNDLSKIIKERKRKIHEKLNDEIQSNKVFRIYMEYEKFSDEAEETDLIDPYAGYADDIENESSEKEDMGFGNYEEPFNENKSYVKEVFAKGATAHHNEEKSRWDLVTDIATEAEKDQQDNKSDHIHTEKNEEEIKEANSSMEDEIEDENEYDLPSLDECIITNNNADSEVPEIITKKDFATRMMEKMGWKQGEGLGKSRQGITTPLMLQMVNKRGGVIVQTSKESDPMENEIQYENEEKENNDNPNCYTASNDEKHCQEEFYNKQAEQPSLSDNKESANITSRYVLLTNAIVIEEMNTSLQDEIEAEAAQFGNLLNTQFIVDESSNQNPSWVNVLCEYESNDQASNALKGLNKAIFKGRIVNASFIPETNSLVHNSNENIIKETKKTKN